MSIRRRSREYAVQFLFQTDFNAGDVRLALDVFWKGNKAEPRTRTFSEELVQGVLAHRDDLDERIRRYSDNWGIKRMNGVDRNAMRLALFEMHHRPDIPPVVSINEALEIVKRYGTPESVRFVNGILDRAVKDVKRSLREAAEPSPTGG